MAFPWYPRLVKVPAAWKDKDVELFVEPVDDAGGLLQRDTGRAAGTFAPR